MKLRLKKREDVWAAIRRRGKEISKTMTDEMLFKSQEFASYATSLADFILRKHRLYALDIQYDTNPNAPIGYTDGKKIYLNTGNPIAATQKLLERRFKANLGVLFHECGHKMFLNFDVFGEIMDTLRSGKLFGNFPDNLPPELADFVTEMEAALASPYRESVVSLFANLSNIVDDGHDEEAMKQCFPNFIADCITTMGEAQFESWDPLEKDVTSGSPAFHIYTFLMLSYAKFGRYKVEASTPEAEAYLERMQEVEPTIDAALLTEDYAERWNYINQLMLFLWPTVRDQFPDTALDSQASPSGAGTPSGSAGGGGSGASGNGIPTPDQLNQAMQGLAEALQQSCGMNPAPQNCSGSGMTIQQAAASANSGSGDAADALAGMVQAITEQQAADEIQKQLDKDQRASIKGAVIPSVHAGITLKTQRHFDTDQAAYDEMYRDIEPIARNLISEMRRLLRELNEECVQHHRRYGPMIEATEAYRPDNAFFAKKKLPDEQPDMAVCVLLDCSGSMSGEKIHAAKKTAILLERFADALGIPLMVAGHDVTGSGVHLNIYTDFVSAMTQRDRYSLGAIQSGGWNRDGLPLYLCCDLLAQRPEKVKMMVVISDGQPSDYDSLEAAYKDITSTVRKYRRTGMLIYGAAIDEDRDIIKQLYGSGFLSIQNLSALPQTLIRLIRQQII